MHIQSLNTPAIGTLITRKVAPAAHPVSDQFGAIAGSVGLVATDFSYRKDEEIYGEEEPAEYVYQVVSGAVRSYKLLSDGRLSRALFQLHAQGILGFSGARQIVLRNRQRLHNLDA